MNTLATPAALTTAALRTSLGATRLQFFVIGVAAGTWGVHVPSAKAHYALNEQSLAIALLAAAIGAVTSLWFAGGLVHRLGVRRTIVGGGLTLSAALALTLATTSYPMLLAVMFVFGASTALFDVAINTEATVLEAHIGRKVMSGLHGMFSLGGMLAAAAGAMLLRFEIAPLVQVVGIAAALALTVSLSAGALLPVHPPEDAGHANHLRPRGALLWLGILAAAGLLAEGAMYDWSVLYMKQELGAPQALAALGYASFSAAMAAGRFAGDWLRTHIAAAPLLAGSCLLSAAAMAVVLLAGEPWVALAGFAIVGAGFANVVPILFLAAGRTPGVTASAAIATVSALGYFGFVFGPPLVGAIAHRVSLTAALWTVVVCAALLAFGGRRLPKA